MLARGPARESGCIEPGDRIKCLNISFENITLQDACDMLNCGSPYKMRLLLEKRAVPAKQLYDKSMGLSPAPIVASNITRYRQHHQNLSRLTPAPTYNNQSQLNLHVSGGPLSTTKAYLKRLTHLVSPQSAQNSGSKIALDHVNNSQSTNSIYQTSTSEHQLLEQPLYLGSAAARQHLSSASSLQVNGAHINAGYGSDEDENKQDINRATNMARDSSSLSSAAQYNQQQQYHQHRRGLSNGDSFGSRLKGRFSVESGETNEPQDSSLDYQQRNANHRLHGPTIYTDESPFGVQPANRGKMMPDLRLATNGGGSSSAQEPANKRKSSGSNQKRQTAASRLTQANQQVADQHLEQTQSQPEIARLARGSQDEIANHSRIGMVDDDDCDKQVRANMTKSSGQAMTSSFSTPTINCLPSSTDTATGWTGLRGGRESIKEETTATVSDRGANDMIVSIGNSESSAGNSCRKDSSTKLTNLGDRITDLVGSNLNDRINVRDKLQTNTTTDNNEATIIDNQEHDLQHHTDLDARM